MCLAGGSELFEEKSKRLSLYGDLMSDKHKMNNEMRLLSMIIIQIVFDFKATTSLNIVHRHLHALKIKVNNHQI